MHQVRLAETDATVKEQRIECDRPALGHAPGGGMGEFVGLAHDEGIEGEALVERRAGKIDSSRDAGLTAGSGAATGLRGCSAGGGNGDLRVTFWPDWTSTW